MESVSMVPPMKINSSLTTCKPLGFLFFLLCLGLLESCQVPNGNHQSNNQMNQHTLKNIELDTYIGKTVGELLEAMPGTYSEQVYFDTGRPGILGGSNFKYDDRWLVVTVNEYQHLKRFNKQYDWDFEAFKKETIAGVNWEE